MVIEHVAKFIVEVRPVVIRDGKKSISYFKGVAVIFAEFEAGEFNFPVV